MRPCTQTRGSQEKRDDLNLEAGAVEQPDQKIIDPHRGRGYRTREGSSRPVRTPPEGAVPPSLSENGEQKEAEGGVRVDDLRS